MAMWLWQGRASSMVLVVGHIRTADKGAEGERRVEVWVQAPQTWRFTCLLRLISTLPLAG